MILESLVTIYFAGTLAAMALKFARSKVVSYKTSTMTLFLRTLQRSANRFHFHFDPARGFISSSLTGRSAYFRPVLPDDRFWDLRFMAQAILCGWSLVPALSKELLEMIRCPRDAKLFPAEVARAITLQTQELLSCGSEYIQGHLIQVCQARETLPQNAETIEDLIKEHFHHILRVN